MLDNLLKRRSQYALGDSLPIPKEEADRLIREAIRQAPSSFNSQSSRALILFGQESRRFWRFVEEALRALVPEPDFPRTQKRLGGFAAGAGTVLFFEDQSVVEELQKKFPLYAENFPIWSEHSTAMAQLAVWTTLADAGVGASLQHYNPLVDDKVAAAWDLPASWKLRAQLPFGSNEAEPTEKNFIDDDGRFLTFG
ncbi:nitroreductase family protein [Paracoccus siganidrum]|uniref:Nitroreductase family protein n=1 Tax=Paracoccus siganidrum TaxID=1276757 RepID=A0A419AAE1_9RHOB|nr:nitroreductase family protein [Paracoccus siganidrum]RJL19907.1 nitroreductase family protein [Paracoccus siganidrum]RMC35137.1 nitroreductase family protein [Paracoccus siganidrum]